VIDCIVLGDSIAVGTQLQRYECVSYSKGGINTWQWNKQYGHKELSAPTVIISLGTNDHKGVKTEKELLTMRANVRASNVFWIMPPCNDKFCKPDINAIVKKIADAHGDLIIGTDRVQQDGIHPSWTGYRELANQTKGN
jgi:lysophospholipase L1-like esterase